MYKKGVSGNPAGRPKRTVEDYDMINACKLLAPEALEVMRKIMTKGDNERNQLSAAIAIIERGYGKAVQPVDAKMAGTVVILDQNDAKI